MKEADYQTQHKFFIKQYLTTATTLTNKTSLYLQANAACFRDLISDKYESWDLVYFPTKTILTSLWWVSYLQREKKKKKSNIDPSQLC